MMNTELTANRVRGCAIGVMIAAGFGSGWLFWSLNALQKIAAGTAIGVELGMLALMAAAVYVARQAKRWPHIPADPEMGSRFAWINVIQWTGIVAVVFGFSRLHIDAYGAATVTIIVGLHYLPLARLFHYPMHYVTGAVLVGWGTMSLLLFNQAVVQGAAALGTGVILWMSAVVMLVLVMRSMAAETAVQSSRSQ
jgi:hypothetical protein